MGESWSTAAFISVLVCVEELVGEGSVEALGFGVGLGPVWAAEGVGDGVAGELGGGFFGSGVRPVVGDDLVDGDPDAAEPDAGALEELAEGLGGLVVEGLDAGEAAVVVYGDVQVAAAEAGAAAGAPRRRGSAAVGPPPAGRPTTPQRA